MTISLPSDCPNGTCHLSFSGLSFLVNLIAAFYYVRVGFRVEIVQGKYDKSISSHIRRRVMRFLLKVNIPVEAGNVAAKANKLGGTIQQILKDLKPEAVYFTDDNGQRTAFIFLDMQDASQVPAIAEPWFLAFNADVEIHPVMVLDDLMKAGPAIEQAIKTYG